MCAYLYSPSELTLYRASCSFQNGGLSWSGQNVSNNFVKVFNELYLFSMEFFFGFFALCLTLDILASLVNAFFLVHDSENPKFGSLNSRARS